MKDNLLNSLNLLNHSPNAVVWVYKSTTPFDNNITESLQEDLSKFISQWKVHGQDFKTYGYILANQFIVLIADDSIQPSGCSIDSSVQFIKSLEAKYSLNLLSNDLVFYLNNDQIESIPFKNIKDTINTQTWVINPHFKNFEDFQKNFVQKAENSMYKRLL